MWLHPHNVLGLHLPVTVEGIWVIERGAQGQCCGCGHHVGGRAEGTSGLAWVAWAASGAVSSQPPTEGHVVGRGLQHCHLTHRGNHPPSWPSVWFCFFLPLPL